MVLRLLPVVLSAYFLAAHFYRVGRLGLAALSAAVPLLLLIPRHWVVRPVQVFLVAGAVEWVRTAMDLTQRYQAQGRPVGRMLVILGAVILCTLAAALVLETSAARARYRRPS